MDLEDFLQNHVKCSTQHNFFYHFTDRSNIESIKKWHLLSMSNAKAQGVTVSKPGGNELSLAEDKRTRMDQFVHLSLTTDHPMAYRAVERGQITDLVWLRINPAVIKRPGVLLTDVVSNSAGMTPLQPADIDKLDLEVVYTRMNWKDSNIMDRLKIARKYEVLVPNFISLSDIRFP